MAALPLVHLLRSPEPPSEKPPVLFLLHGVGSNEYDLFGLVPVLDERFLVISVRAPNTLQQGSYAWFEIRFAPQGIQVQAEQVEKSLAVLTTFIQEATGFYGGDPKRVYLMGFSQGAIMSAA